MAVVHYHRGGAALTSLQTPPEHELVRLFKLPVVRQFTAREFALGFPCLRRAAFLSGCPWRLGNAEPTIATQAAGWQ